MKRRTLLTMWNKRHAGTNQEQPRECRNVKRKQLKKDCDKKNICEKVIRNILSGKVIKNIS